jgi:hypothetical protein
MDDDLAFCLGRFIDDQVQIIDDRLEDIKKKEIIKCQEIEKEKISYDEKKPAPKNKGSHYEDKALVDQFIQELRDVIQTKNTKTIINDQTCIDTLRAETSTKINASSNYLNQLRNLARPMPNSSSFVQSCNAAIDYFKKAQEFESNFKGLMTVLEQSESDNVVQNVQTWWKNAYGSTIADLNRRNDRFNKAVTENNFAVLSHRSRIIDNARKLLAARKVISVPPPTLDIIRKFVRRLLSIDEEQREKTDADELINQLHSHDIEEVINYTQQWLAKRDEIRNQKEEPNPCKPPPP